MTQILSWEPTMLLGKPTADYQHAVLDVPGTASVLLHQNGYGSFHAIVKVLNPETETNVMVTWPDAEPDHGIPEAEVKAWAERSLPHLVEMFGHPTPARPGLHLPDIKARLDEANADSRATDFRCAMLAMVALALTARELSPAAARILLTETDDNDSGELWAQAVYDAEGGTVADSEVFDRLPVATYLHAANDEVWEPFVTVETASGRASLGEYLLDIDEVLRTVPGWLESGNTGG